MQAVLKTVGLFFKSLNIELSYDLEIQLLDIYPKKLKSRSWMDICKPIFIAALFMIPERYKQLKCPSTDNRWTKCGI